MPSLAIHESHVHASKVTFYSASFIPCKTTLAAAVERLYSRDNLRCAPAIFAILYYISRISHIRLVCARLINFYCAHYSTFYPRDICIMHRNVYFLTFAVCYQSFFSFYFLIFFCCKFCCRHVQ